MRSLKLLTPAVIAASLCAPPVLAADLGVPLAPPPQVVDPQMEFGNSWYLRGDIGAVLETQPKISNDLNLLSDKKRKAALSADFGFGYKINEWLRTDIIAEYRTQQTRSGIGGLVTNCPTAIGVPGNCDVRGYSKLSHWNLLANADVDLGNWSGVTPYVGAGAGVSFNVSRGSVAYTIAGTGTPYIAPIDPITLLPISPVLNRVQSTGANTHFAWNVMAGLGYALNEHATIDLGYRYLNMGRFTGVADSSGAISKKQLTSHEVRLGVRYMID